MRCFSARRGIDASLDIGGRLLPARIGYLRIFGRSSGAPARVKTKPEVMKVMAQVPFGPEGRDEKNAGS
jgi:hypothetical protein